MKNLDFIVNNLLQYLCNRLLHNIEGKLSPMKKKILSPELQ